MHIIWKRWWHITASSVAQAERIRKLMTALGMSGIGGKISSGYGSFTVVEELPIINSPDAQINWLNQALNCESAKHWLLLTTSLPNDDELDGVLEDAQYQLVRRAGFVQSDTFAKSPVRKRTQVFMAAGAMLTRRFNGALYSAADAGTHPVLRYAMPIMLGVAF